MAEEKKSFPMMPAKSWWALRKKFRSTLPKEVTANYLAATLGMTEPSARNNIIPSLRITGLIDKDGKPTERAVKWRDDKQYAHVCKAIMQEVYPQELLDLAPDASTDRSAIQTWFANQTGVGENAASKSAAFYALLLEADPSKESEVSSPTPTPRKKTAPAVRPKANSSKETGSTDAERQEEAPPEHAKKRQPSIHVNIEIHISPQASADQIDQIFSSMAKHLKDFA